MAAKFSLRRPRFRAHRGAEITSNHDDGDDANERYLVASLLINRRAAFVCQAGSGAIN